MPGSAFADDDDYVDLPLWGDDEPGICRNCGEIVEDPDDNYCNACQETGE